MPFPKLGRTYKTRYEKKYERLREEGVRVEWDV